MTSTSPFTLTWQQLQRPWLAQSQVWRCGTGCGSRLQSLTPLLVCLWKQRAWSSYFFHQLTLAFFFLHVLSLAHRILCYAFHLCGWSLAKAPFYQFRVLKHFFKSNLITNSHHEKGITGYPSVKMCLYLSIKFSCGLINVSNMDDSDLLV